ncbi:DUF726-domain-containing protein [Annulohypoxylon bovei var. microspora]|nr:DUF726-domain-containing protein [Annulohypoxylon bovei var. microspora]
MVRNSTPRGGRMARRFEIDLSDLFDVAQKNQYLSLVNAIADDMHKQTRDNYDRLTLGRLSDNQGINAPKAEIHIMPNPNNENDRHLFDNQGPTYTSPSNAQKKELKYPGSPQELQEMLGKTDTDVLTDCVGEQKKDTLSHFNKWRVSMSKRFGDIVVKNGGTTGTIRGYRNGVGGYGSHGGQKQPNIPGNARQQGTQQRNTLPSVHTAHASLKGKRAASSGLHLPAVNPAEVQAMLQKAYPIVDTPLKQCSKEKRMLIMHCTLLIFLGLDQYCLYSRILLARLAASLDIPQIVLLKDESRVALALSNIVMGIPVDEIVRRRAEEAKSSRRWKPGMVMVSLSGNGSTLSGPLVAANIGTVFELLAGISPSATAGLLGPMNESTVVVGTLFGLYGARQGSKTIEAHRKDVLDFGMVSVHGANSPELIDPKDVPTKDRRMRVTIGVSGMLTDRDNFIDPWKVLGHENESYVMRYEVEALKKMGNSLEAALQTFPGHNAKKQMASVNIFDRLREALWPVGIVKVSKVIDNPWCIGVVRAEKAGVVLADILVNRLYGERPVSLVGYSLGARVIYACLMALNDKKAFGLVENVLMIGAPFLTEVRSISTLKSVVAGRLINVYSDQDYMLGFLYRNCHWNLGIAGLQPIRGVPFVENLNMSGIVTNHLQYPYLIGYILNRVGWEDIDNTHNAEQRSKLNALMDAEKKLDEEREQIWKGKNGLSAYGEQETVEVEHVRVITNKPRGGKFGKK